MTKLKRVGYFREMRHGDPTGASLHNARQAQASADEAQLVNYLDAGNILVATAGPSIDVLDPDQPKIASAHVMTDGVYSWPGDLGYYVNKYHVRLPDEFLAHMASNNWNVPAVNRIALQKADDKAKWNEHAEDIARRFVKAHVEYDVPDAAFAREAREAAREDEDERSIREFYVKTGQKRTNETLAQALTIFESVPRHSGARVGAWNYNRDGELRLYTVGPNGAKPLESVEAGQHEREDVNAKLIASGARIGGTYSDAFGTTKYVWAIDGDGADVWSDRGHVCHLTIELDVARVRTFFDVADPGHRGVVMEPRAGRDALVVDEHDAAGRADPTYNADSLSVDIEWAFYLGRDLAMWRGVPHYDQLTDTITNQDHLRIRKAAFELASDVEHMPDLGDFEQISKEMGRVGKAANVTLRYRPSPAEAHLRDLEIRVTFASGQTSEQRITQGTNNEAAAFLRRVQSADLLLRATNTSRARNS